MARSSSKSEVLALIDPVDLPEIARRLGVKLHTTYVWMHHNKLPEPDVRFSQRPVWSWAKIEEWAKTTGRLS